MKIKNLLNKGYFPKELPPSFNTELFGNDYSNISALVESTKSIGLANLENSVNSIVGLSITEEAEEKIKLKQIT